MSLLFVDTSDVEQIVLQLSLGGMRYAVSPPVSVEQQEDCSIVTIILSNLSQFSKFFNCCKVC